MKLTKTSAQAALALAFLAGRREGGPTQARQVAEHLGVPTDSALKVLQALARHQLLRSRLGRGGGYTLHLPADAVTLLRIVEAIDGPIRMDVPLQPAEDGSAPGPGGGPAPGLHLLRHFCECSAAGLREQLARLTVADLASAGAPPARLVAAG